MGRKNNAGMGLAETTERKRKMTEEQKKEWAAMEDRLMPASGKAETVAGEIIRAVDRIWYRWYNDGDKINVGYGKETCNGTARFLEKIRGAEFPAEATVVGSQSPLAFQSPCGHC